MNTLMSDVNVIVGGVKSINGGYFDNGLTDWQRSQNILVVTDGDNSVNGDQIIALDFYC